MVSMQDVYGAFVGSFGLNVRMMNEMCRIRSIDISPKPGSLLHLPAAPDATFRLPLDYVIAPTVIINHAWDTETIMLARAIMQGRFAEATLVDVGANSGLFSRQMLGMSSEFRHAFAYEPHPGNFACLTHNLAPFGCVQACNDALGHEAGTLRFHLDPENAGNYSLNQSAMPSDRDCATMTVSVRSAGLEAERWLSTGAPVFYKSDTQGHDELIATSIATPFWDRVFAGIFELWHIDKPHSSDEQLTVLLDRFAHKRFLQDRDTPLSTADVLAYRAGNDRGFKDIVFWK